MSSPENAPETSGTSHRTEKVILNSIVLICLAIPLLLPFSLPLNVSAPVRKMYEIIDQLPSGSLVMWDQGGNLDTWPVHGDALIAAITHVLQRNLKLVIVEAGSSQGTVIAQMVLDRLPTGLLASKEYGVDYIHLGFLPGEEAAVSTLATKFKQAYTTDVNRTPVESLPLWGEITDATSFRVIIQQPRSEQYTFYMRHWAQVKRPLVVITATTMAPNLQPFFASGQVSGFIGGVRGAAEYESLLRTPAGASAGIGSLTLGVAVYLVAIIVGNVLTIIKKKSDGKQVTA